jgi:hypothetical protein
MRLLPLLMLPAITFAAPVPKQLEKPTVELTLAAQNPLVLEITIQNHGKEPIELPYRVTPFEHLVVELQGEKGKPYKVEHTGEADEKAEPGTLKVPPGESTTLTLHTCHYLPEVGEPGQQVTFTARLKHDGKTFESKPLTVK